MNPSASSLGNTLAYRAFEDTASIPPLKERAHPGLHAEILDQLLKHVRTRGPLLDLGCGTGAWLSRLQQHGFSEVLGADCDVEAFGLDPANQVPVDLDEAYSATIDRSFDVITAIETIEHVESPAHFLREARKLINPGGFLFVTTPNVECIQSRLRFLLKGRLRGFEDDGTADPTHISPLLTSLLPRLTTRSGWKIDERMNLLKNGSRASTRLVCSLLSPFLKGDAKQGDCHLFILRPI
jgi:2-polyprenyl-3-methyl-5-hydroxy-6-metoxy-1,4-benzoquinol methylase